MFTEREGFDKDIMLKSDFYPCQEDKSLSLLELCCYHGAVNCFKFLRAEFNSKITETCLELSFLGENPDIMSECLKYIEPTASCMIMAIVSHNIDFVTFLLNEYNISIDDKLFLHYCCMHQNLQAFLVYLHHTKSINICFVYSPSFNIPALCAHFLSYGIDVNKGEDQKGRTALHIAAKYNCKETTKFLISNGADVDAQDCNKHITPLHLAPKYDHHQIADILINNGADINIYDYFRRTALHYTAINDNNSLKTAKILISHGINLNFRDGNGYTAVIYAVINNHFELADLLLSSGASTDRFPHWDTILHFAASTKSTIFTKLLIEKDSYVDKRNRDGDTPLHITAMNDSRKNAEILISSGAKVNIKNKKGQTPLHLAIKYSSREFIKLLLTHGADINKKDKNGETALDYALKDHNHDIIELLNSHTTILKKFIIHNYA
ncbi:ankyrin repeat protein, putative [Trichomonas vaginalis G3]|uniref:Ankyrin repeat protein, putative n=1 Tax=Trichomonas vaginalis (strain ATCC PRA-98 / G3) TaxID=412133 RepID=A2E4Y1_TRIV3|nr:spectrin binding [Trichomonas vaginalis G3]EAY12320.1 ankyrin repeat protein, putative [Trichomonas vaginalis G3]KAI5552448.1 spectrin binding [Trichomonas vaginalis G3]|eukprot:XP_001324543.1 ankyrin repeat protein [Trichomonas vaginalis G3]